GRGGRRGTGLQAGRGHARSADPDQSPVRRLLAKGGRQRCAVKIAGCFTGGENQAWVRTEAGHRHSFSAAPRVRHSRDCRAVWFKCRPRVNCEMKLGFDRMPPCHGVPVGRSMRPRSFVLAVALVAVAGTGVYVYGQREDSPPQYVVSRVERGPLTAFVSATGSLSAVTTVAVGSQVSGQLKTIHVDFNSRVRKGQLIAELDPDTFEAKV